MSKQLEKLVRLLTELFQLDQPDLDFGLYRIMHAKSDEISQFLDKDLLPQVQQAFSQYKTADKAELEKELKELVAGIEKAGMDPDGSPKVKELKQKIADDSVDVAALENEVYDHLFSFFRRYYHEGDFLAKRVYKPGVYAIPYEGEEVKLHWANRDQYYIKTSEYLRDYAFTLKPADEKDPMRAHFRLVEASEGEHGNVKAAEGTDRVFILVSDDFMADEAGELVIRFHYRPATMNDWPAESFANATAAAKKKPPVQRVLLADAVKRILAVDTPELKRWISELSRNHVKVDGETADYSRLEGHLNRYTKRHEFDYFIHKDLGGFLRRELDFFIKNEIMHIDDVASETAARVEQYLPKIRVVREIGNRLIDFLSQLEEFQKKLWLKRKFVTDSEYCIALSEIPESYYSEIITNESQVSEWKNLLSIDKIEGGNGFLRLSEPITEEFLSHFGSLLIDTSHFSKSFKARLLDEFDQIDARVDGVLVHGENFQALSLLAGRYRNQVECIYIDPPYNTGDSEISYKNSYLHSSWITLMQNRIEQGINLMTEDSVLYVAIDDFEMANLANLIDSELPGFRREMIIVNHHPQGGKAKTLAHTHEYMLACVPKSSDRTLVGRMVDDGIERRPFKRSGTAESNFRYGRPNSFYAILVEPQTLKVVGLEPPPEGDNYSNDDTAEGLLRIFPIGAQDEERVWRLSYESAKRLVEASSLDCTENHTIYQLIEAKDRSAALFSNWVCSRYNAGTMGANLLREIIGEQNPFSYPKSIHTVGDAIFAAGLEADAIVLDFFAGSGTTAHAVINLNREDGGRRKFILVEMGNYFDSVILPRVKKITFSPEWKSGAPVRYADNQESERAPKFVKILRLESYEDALNNLKFRKTFAQEDLLGREEAGGPSGPREQYFLKYMLHVESRGSSSLLNISKFSDPTAYKLIVKQPGSDENRDVDVDLSETFNYLIGLTVSHIAAPQTFGAAFKPDDEGRLRLDGRLKQDDNGPWWFRTVDGVTPDRRKTLVIWRKLTGDAEQDNLVLDEWFTRSGYSTQDYEFDLIYVNGDNNLENLRQPDEMWKVRLIEEDFHRLMFDIENV